MKRWLLVALTLLCLAALPACSGSSGEIPLPKEPERVAVLFSSLAQIWQEAGGTVAITVGETVERGFAEPDALLVDTGAGKNVNLELLLRYQPDLVIGSADIPAHVEGAVLLRQAGIPVMLCRVECFQDYLAVLADMTALTGERAGLEAALAMEAEIDGVLAAAAGRAPVRILFVRSGSTNASTKAKTAADHFACAMLEQLGCVNVADTDSLSGEGLGMEGILQADPDFVFFSLMGDEAAARAHVESLLAGEVWGRLTAVREGRAVILPRELFHFKPCGRWGEAYGYLATLLCGEGEA